MFYLLTRQVWCVHGAQLQNGYYQLSRHHSRWVRHFKRHRLLGKQKKSEIFQQQSIYYKLVLIDTKSC